MRLSKTKAAAAVLLSLGLLGCARQGDIYETGILTTYTACPAVSIPAPAGDITLFDPPASRDAAAIDVVATITNLRQTCDETGEYIVTNATFDVHAQRRDNRGAREVAVPDVLARYWPSSKRRPTRLTFLAMTFSPLWTTVAK